MVLAVQVSLMASTELIEYQHVLAILISACLAPEIGRLYE